MVLAAGDVVAVHRASAAPVVEYQGQPPMMGVVAIGDEGQLPGGVVEVAWYDGKYETILPDFTLDKLLAPATTSLFGLVVRVEPGASGTADSDEFVGPVCQEFRRDLNGGGAPEDSHCLVKCLSSGVWYEVPAARVVATEGR